MKDFIENAFTYHPPKEGQPTKYVAIRDMAKNFASTIDDLAPDSGEKTLAIRKIQEAVMWANAAIATHA